MVPEVAQTLLDQNVFDETCPRCGEFLSEFFTDICWTRQWFERDEEGYVIEFTNEPGVYKTPCPHCDVDLIGRYDDEGMKVWLFACRSEADERYLKGEY